MPYHDAEGVHTTENRQHMNGGLRCAGQLLLQGLPCREQIIADRGLNLSLHTVLNSTVCSKAQHNEYILSFDEQ